jgi:hypothetical protein
MQRRAFKYGESNQLRLPKDAVLPPLKMAEFVGQDLAELAGILATASASTGRTLGTESLVETNLDRLLDAESHLLTHEILADPRVRQMVDENISVGNCHGLYYCYGTWNP